MAIPGYAGKILYIDLTSREVKKEDLDPRLVEDFIGGFGINTKLAYDLIPPTADPFSPENRIIIGAGVFGGTPAIGASQTMITTRFPINGAFGTGSGGGRFSHMLKWSGYDHVVISGRADKPVYIRILDDEVELCDAADLWGKDLYETLDALRARHEPCSIIPISQAGENLVRVSLTMIDGYGTVGAGGLPAVMGSKNLKAVVAQQGSRAITPADRLQFIKLVDNWAQQMTSWPGWEAQVKRGVCAADIQPAITAGNLTGGWTDAFPWLDKAQVDVFQDLHDRDRRGIACAGCVFQCKEALHVSTGEYAGTVVHHHAYPSIRFEFEDGADAYGKISKFSETLNKYGICYHAFRSLINLASLLYEKGIITREDTGGIEIKRDFDTAMKLIPMIALKQGFGKVLAEGAYNAARQIGKGAEQYVVQVKGRDVVGDPRLGGLHPSAFHQIVDPRGSHAGLGKSVTFTGGRPFEILQREAKKQGMPDEAIQRSLSAPQINPGRAAKWGQDASVCWSLFGLCNQIYIHRFYRIEDIAAMYTALTGQEADAARLMKAAERSWIVYKLLNVRAGFDRKDDKAPETWFKPIKARDAEYSMKDYHQTVTIGRDEVQKFLDDYYEERGYDPKTGTPTLGKLKELGLEAMAPAAT